MESWRSNLRDKFDIALFVIMFLIGVGIIYFVPNGKDGYYFIPALIYWNIRFIRRKNKAKKRELKG